ncbi:MAG TPA: hypothetical protein VGK38_14845 [Prolixibacteraceae bacterium]
MKTITSNINISVDFNQVVDIVRQLPYKEKIKLGEVIRKEIKANNQNDKVLTHFASEKTLAKDWLSAEEDEVWSFLIFR